MSNSNLSISLNSLNLIMSVGLVTLGILLIIYSFDLPANKCSNSSKDKCLEVEQKFPVKNKGKTVQNLRIVALITGFLLIIPLGLNIIQMFLYKN